ncbi:inactive pancreatic lipase-related protein 1-like [Palaemon carinicauda]|uniref:inactive pancreatic lipase-related protein 1-like n=1 Tax=Palaemon carinicauda TaxID=392227 RepID=UPI0035B5753C
MRLILLSAVLISALKGGIAEILVARPDRRFEGVLPEPDHEIVRPDGAEILRRTERSHKNGKLLEVRHFYLWTRDTSANASEILDPTDPESIGNTTFAPRKTFIIVHGFLGWGTEDWILSIKDKLLSLVDCNVIAVDWPAGTSVVQYYVVVGRVVYVAQDLALLLNVLMAKKGLDMGDIHAVGHSLGAHVTGLAAKAIPARFGRITGLDPAGLTYHNTGPSERLDRGDAEYVDVMHTNGCNTKLNPWFSCYGINENLGHSDFWPNGGEYQPACRSPHKLEGDLGCDHMMAYKYFLESIDYGIEDTLFLSRNCSDWGDYAAGNCPCSDGAQYMGFYANEEMPGVFYLNTSGSVPYAERDAVCSPGKTVKDNIVMILASTGSGLMVLFILAGVAILALRRRRDSEEINSGLLIEEDGDDRIIDDEVPLPPTPPMSGAEDDDDALLIRDENSSATAGDGVSTSVSC